MTAYQLFYSKMSPLSLLPSFRSRIPSSQCRWSNAISTANSPLFGDLALSGFTLIELLVVMAIIGILAVVAVPAVSSIGNAGNMNRAVSGISLLLDEARTYAMAHNTYVWVGFAPNAPTEQLTVGVVAGATGSVDDLSSARPLVKFQTYDHLALATLNGITGMSTSSDNIANSQVGTFTQTEGGNTVTFTDILQFSPGGEATLGVTPPDNAHCVQIGLQPARGGNTNNSNIAVFQVATLTGQVQVFRP